MLRTRLYLGLLPLLLLFIGAGLAAMRVCQDLASTVETKVLSSYRLMIGCYELRETATQLANTLQFAQSSLNNLTPRTRSDYEAHRARFQKELMAQSALCAGTPRSQPLAAAGEAFDQLRSIGDDLFTHGPDASLNRYQQTEAALFTTLRSLEALAESDHQELKNEASRITGLARTSNRVVLVALVIGIGLSLLISALLARHLLKPIRALTTSARALGEGNLEQDVPVTSRDELGELALTFNTMAAKLRAYREATTAKVLRIQRTMEATLTSTPDPLFLVDHNGKPEVRNPAAETLFPNGLPQILSLRICHVLTSRAHYLPTGYDHVITIPHEREERHYLPRILSIGDTLTGHGGAALILQDVTKFRLLDDAKNNLVGTVSHELKTPLTSLRMAVYLLLEKHVGPLNPSQIDLLETARDDADRLLRILNDLLDLSRLESGASALNFRNIAPADLLAEMAREMKTIADAAQQTISIQLAPHLPQLHVDPDRLRHVFINLLANASKYSPPSTTITLYADRADQGYLRCGVRDQGPGIPSESIPHVFEKFYRVPSETRKGAGIGLTIAREIVIAHGGTISCQSSPGHGSDFYFLLPTVATGETPTPFPTTS